MEAEMPDSIEMQVEELKLVWNPNVMGIPMITGAKYSGEKGDVNLVWTWKRGRSRLRLTVNKETIVTYDRHGGNLKIFKEDLDITPKSAIYYGSTKG